MADKMAKGRHRFLSGQENPSAILTNSQVKEIRRRFIPFTRGLKAQLAVEFGVSERTIKAVVFEENWQAVDAAA
jgi:hypothetical protein